MIQLTLFNPLNPKVKIWIPGLSFRGGGRGFPPATMNVFPGYFQKKMKEKENWKKFLAVWFPAYLLHLRGNLKS